MVWNVINLAKNFQFLKQNGKGDDVIQMKATQQNYVIALSLHLSGILKKEYIV